MGDVIVRHARNNDDYKKIASCIYLTDPYIYSAAFGAEIQLAAYAISKLMAINGGLFSCDNLVLALCGDEICGVLLYNKDGVTWNLKECIDEIQGIVPNEKDFIYVADTYFSVEAAVPPANHMEIIACCVMPGFRNMGIGKMMLNWLIQEYPEHILTLDVLVDNGAAINLYKKCGFEIVEELKGFSLDEKSRPDCYHMVRKCE